MIPALLALLLAAGAVDWPGTTARVEQQRTRPARATTACAAVTRADVEREVRRSVSEGVAEERGKQSTCDYTTRFGQITVTMQKLSAPVDLSTAIPEIVAALPAASARPAATALPDTKAFFIDIGTVGTQLHLIRDNRDHLLISVLGCGTPTEASRIATALAQSALSRTATNQ